MKPRDVSIVIQTKAGFGVSEPPSELDGLDAGLVPQGCPAVPQTVGRESGSAHFVADAVAVPDGKRQAFFQRLQQEGWRVDRSTYPLTLRAFTSHSDPSAHNVHVAWLQSQGLRHTTSDLLHHHHRKPIGGWDVLQDAQNLVEIRWSRLGGNVSWKLNPSVSGDVGDAGEVEHQPQLGHEQTNGAGLVDAEAADPLSDVTNADLVDGFVAEGVEEDGGAEPVAVQRALSDATAGREPLRMEVLEQGAALDGTLQFRLRIFRGSQPIAYEIATDNGLSFGTEGTSVFYLRVPAAPPVANIEPAAIPGVPNTDVKGRQ